MKKPFAPLMLLLALFGSFSLYSQPNLSSMPTAAATIYLDFDGHDVASAYWNGGKAFTCAPAGFDDRQITEIYNRVAEDYRPFDINITTDLSKYLEAPLSDRVRIVITTTSTWFGGAGGVALTGSFKWGDDTPAFVFCDRLGPNNPKMVAECCSHESGHTIGLSHQSTYDGTCNLTSTYNEGAGTGVNAWAPIMGNSYYRNMSGWNNGPTPYGCANTQDNLSIITTQNGFSFRADDFSDDINLNPARFSTTGEKTAGIITTSKDQDAFVFTLPGKSFVQLNLEPFSAGANYEGANLDIKVNLYNSSKVLIRTYDPAAAMNVKLDTILNSGDYYLLVDGAGNMNTEDYGSLGSYTITAAVTAMPPAFNISLSGQVENNKHLLGWNVVSEEPVRSICLEYSADGIHFLQLTSGKDLTNSFAYTPFQSTDLYYRVKMVSVSGRIAYSDTSMIKALDNAVKWFDVSTFVRHEITVNTACKYQYQLNDMNGNVLCRGIGQAGFNKVDMSRYPAGMYVLQLINNNKKQIERIIKQ